MHSNQRVSITPTNPDCPCDDHTDGPDGYLQWFDWAERMGRTHSQLKCAGCGLYKVWIRR